MTNLLFSVVVLLSTNVVDTDNHKGCATCDGIARNNWLLYHPHPENTEMYQAATQRTVTTTIERITNAVEVVHGYSLELGRVRLSERKELFNLETAWKKQSDTVETNFPSPIQITWNGTGSNRMVFITNGASFLTVTNGNTIITVPR